MLGSRQWRHGAFCVSRQHRLRRPMTTAHFDVFIHRLWIKVYHRWITNNFPCKWHTSTTSDSKSSPRKIFHRNSSEARTPTSNSAWTTKEKTSTRNVPWSRRNIAWHSEGNADNKRQRNRRLESEALWSFTVENPSPPIYLDQSRQSFSSVLRPERN